MALDAATAQHVILYPLLASGTGKHESHGETTRAPAQARPPDLGLIGVSGDNLAAGPRRDCSPCFRLHRRFNPLDMAVDE